MSKSKVWTDQNAGTAQSGRVELNKENKKIAQSERLASVEGVCGLDRGIGGGGRPVGLAFQKWHGIL